jgi:hypothetical protein
MVYLVKRLLVIPFVAAVALCGQCQAEPVRATSSYEFARAFVDQLVETHQGEELAAREISAAQKAPDSGQQILLSAVRNCTRMKLKLNVMIRRVEQTHLADANFDKLPPYLMQMYARKAELCDEIVQSAQTLLEGPKPGVDYGKLAGHMPEVTAQVEYVNEAIFKATPMVAMSFVSKKPDSKNHLSHLSITRRQAQELVGRLQSMFGKSLDAKDQNWTTSSASLLRMVLRDKGYQFADDPWH